MCGRIGAGAEGVGMCGRIGAGAGVPAKTRLTSRVCK